MSIPTNTYNLGIDLGVSSLGAALVDPEAEQIVWTGVRIFTPGFEGDYESGNEESRAQQRRLARQQRRQTDRRRRRRLNVFRILQQYALLPCGQREQVFAQLDAQLRCRYPETEILPYLLRARAVESGLDPYEIGRALYHLAQRRGFRGRAIREADDKDAKEGGTLKEQIEGLWKEIRESGSRTLGEHLSKLNPHESRIRDQRTHRRMYEEEFDAIWECQRGYHPEMLTDDRKQVLHRALFDQRPLKPADHLVGLCNLEPTESRAPMWMPSAQRYRVLTAINNLVFVDPNGPPRPLTSRERGALVEECRNKEKVSFAQVKKLLGFPRNSRFSIEEGGEKNLPGNATSHRLFRVLGDAWTEMPIENQNELAADIADPKRHETDEDLHRCLVEKWAFPEAVAQKLCGVSLPDKYASLSLKAIEKVTQLLERGMTFAEAKRELWPEHFTEKEPLDFLPPVKEIQQLAQEIRNPVVLRCLSELRKTVNAVVRRYGKPASIHIELARQMKRSRDERQKETKRNREREKKRDEAKKELKPFCGDNVPPPQIEKYLLWLECGKVCPYSGERIPLAALFGEYPRFDVEHIVPFERSLDGSFQNKTLCEAGYNKTKGKHTPWEAFGHTDEWPQMEARVREFGNLAKLRRFTMTETDTEKLLKEFTQRQLIDTQYASRLAARYLGALYGIDRCDGKRIITCAGAVTAFLRQKWDLNRILNDKPAKSRDDHRHHAVDAVAVAMAGPAQIKALSDAARRALSEGHHRFGSLADPWPEFREQSRSMILSTLVSHRPKRRLAGALHEETNYTAPEERGGKPVTRCRKPVAALSKNDIPNIVDPTVREIVKAAWEAVGEDAKKLQDNWPVIETSGRRIPIKKVRCFESKTVRAIACDSPTRVRYVVPGTNHHMAVFEIDTAAGKPRKWAYETVKLIDAAERHMKALRGLPTVPVVNRENGPRHRFCFSLSEGDLVAAQRSHDEPEQIWYVRTVRSRGSFELTPASDARQKKDCEVWDVQLNTLMKLGGRKVVVTPLGEVVEAHD